MPLGLPQANIISTFSEYGNAAYQVKGNEAYNNMLANILLLLITLTPGAGSKGYFVFFSKNKHVEQVGITRKSMASLCRRFPLH